MAPCWYVAYGSNTCRARLTAYLEGVCGPPYGDHRGCLDPAPPADDRWLVLDRAVRFRGRSPRWGGGVAFLDLVASAASTPARAWLLGVDQLLGIAAQEARLAADPPASVLDGCTVGSAVVIGGGWYDTVLRLPDLDGIPSYAITTSQDLPLAPATDAYAATLRAGRSEPDAGGRLPG